MTDEQPHELIAGKSAEELIAALARHDYDPFSPVGVAVQAAIQARLAERLARPRLWAIVAAIAAVVSALAAVADGISHR